MYFVVLYFYCNFYVECKNVNEAKLVKVEYDKVLEAISLQPSTMGCPLPCTRSSYGLEINYYYDNGVDIQVRV